MKRSGFFTLVLVWTSTVLGAADGPPAYRIDTVAGSGSIGDGGPAIRAQLGAVQGIALDRSGNLYLSDTDHHRIRKVTAAGTITTVAGTGTPGFSGDGGPSTAAALNLPYGVAVDLGGSIYIADLGNHRVRRIDPSGNITTVAGTGIKGSLGDGGPASAAQLSTPRNVAVDSSGNLYVSEFEGARIRRISPDGRIATIAGTGVAGFLGDGGLATAAQLNSPAGLAVDLSGSLYVADSQNNRIRKIAATGIISTVVGSALGGIPIPHAVAVDGAGTIYVAGITSTVVYACTPDGKTVPFAGAGYQDFQGDGGPATAAALTNVLDVALDSGGAVFLADGARVRRVDLLGNIQTVAGDGFYQLVGDGGNATDAVLHHPSAVALDGLGNLFIADTGTERVRQVTVAHTIATVAGLGTTVWGIAPEKVPAVSAGLNSPMGIAVDPVGNLFIADTDNHNIRKVGADQLIVTVVGTSQGGVGPDLQPPLQTTLLGPQGVCFDRGGTLFVVDTSNHRVLRVTSGSLTEVVAGAGVPGNDGDGGPARAAHLSQPASCALDSFGNLFVADTWNHRIRKVTRGGVISTVAGTGDPGFSGDEGPGAMAQIRAPRGLAVNDSGDLFIADTGNHRIRQMTPDGIIHTVAGQGMAGFQGDGGAAAQALLDSPGGLFLDGAGSLYFADTGNDRVRRLTVGSTSTGVTLESAQSLAAANAASMRTGPIAPGEIVILTGAGLGPAAGAAATFSSGSLPTRLGDTEVHFDGLAAPLFYVQSGQINLQAPYEVSGKSTTHVEVWYQGRLASAIDLSVVPSAPALYPAASNADGSVNSSAHAASAGSLVTLYATGEGLSDGANASGRTVQSPYPHPRLPVAVKMANIAATVVDASAAPGVVGILQITARVPAGIAAGQSTLQLTVGGAAAPDFALWVKP